MNTKCRLYFYSYIRFFSSKKKSKVSENKLRNYTAKVFFGPLLETAKQRSKKLKEPATIHKTQSQKKVNSDLVNGLVYTSAAAAGSYSDKMVNTKKIILKNNNSEVRSSSLDSVSSAVLTKTEDLPCDTKVEKYSEAISAKNNFSYVKHYLFDPNYLETFPLFYTNNNKLLNEVRPEENVNSIQMPSVTKILEYTMPLSSRIALHRWEMKMVAQLGEDGFKKYRQDLLDRGKLYHQCLQSELSGIKFSVQSQPEIMKLWESVEHIVKDISDIQVVEKNLCHPYLCYQGNVDCIANYRGLPVVIEWKTSGKERTSLKNTYDDPLQLVAYLGALNYDLNYSYQSAAQVLLVYAYNSGSPAHAHLLNQEQCEHFWTMWCTRLTLYWQVIKNIKSSKNVI